MKLAMNHAASTPTAGVAQVEKRLVVVTLAE